MIVFQLYETSFALFAILIVGGLIGFKFASTIQNTTLYILFWLMYIITFLCVINFLSSIFIFGLVKDKEGRPGLQGERGSKGDLGDEGVCDPKCRDGMCYKELLFECNKYLNQKEPNTTKPINISNRYWKTRLMKICSSKDFSALETIKGRESIMGYVIETLKIWMDLLYREGGRTYFETIGVENEFNWRKSNPWDEIKKYDMYYWGMPESFKIRIKNKCKPPPPPRTESEPRLKLFQSNAYDFLWQHKWNRSWRLRDSNESWWRPKQFIHKGETYYPLGDAFFKINKDSGECQSRGVHAGDYEYNEGPCSGPSGKTALIGGKDTKPPVDYEKVKTSNFRWCKNWLCRVSRYKIGKKRRDWLTVWKPIAPPGYRCLGDVVTWDGDRDNKPSTNLIRCVPEECTEKVPYNNNYSFGFDGLMIHQPWGHSERDKTYHLFTGSRESEYSGNQADHASYRIKEECLQPEQLSEHQEVAEIIDEDPSTNHEHSKGYFHQPSKENKYSVFQYLELPSEAVLVNMGNSRVRLYIRHIEGTHYNQYHILKQSEDAIENKSYQTMLNASNYQTVEWVEENEPKKESYIWMVEMDQTTHGKLTIKSRMHNRYLKAFSPTNMSLVLPTQTDNNTYWKLAG